MSAPARTLQRGRAEVGARRHDAVPKVTGTFAYSSDLEVAGMLWGHTVRSPHAHARVVGIDASDALRLPGVHAVLTHEDVPGKKTYGLEFADQPVLAFERVRYFGEAVAVVAAEEPEQARRAAAAVRVEYEPLDPVTDPELATELEPLHPDRPTMGHGRRDDPRPNVVRTIVIRRGDPDAEGEVTVSGVYETRQQDQTFLGPESGLAIPDGEGGVDIHVATQWLHVDRDQVAPCLDLPPEQVRIHLAGVGGAFGGREDLSIQIHAALLALRTVRPVKMVYNREESFVGHIHRHPSRIWAEHSATKDGRLVSARVRILLDGGAYASSTAAVLANACCFAVGPYAVENVSIEGTAVYTNNPPCGAMRGFGAVQATFAAEGQMDRLAAALDIDPVELAAPERPRARRRPPDRPGRGRVSADEEVIRRAAAMPLPEPEALPREAIRLPGGSGTTRGEGVRRGVGFAVGPEEHLLLGGLRRLLRGQGQAVRGRARGGALRRRRGGPGRHGRHAAGRSLELGTDDVTLVGGSTAHVESSGSTSASPDDLDGGGGGQLASPGRARGARARRAAGKSTSSACIGIRARSRSIPRPGRSWASARTRVRGRRDGRAVVEVDVELGLTRVVWIGTAQDVGHARPDRGRGPDRGRHGAGPRPRPDGGDPGGTA